MTKTAPSPSASSEPKQFWTRRSLIAAVAVFLPLPFLLGWLDTLGLNISSDTRGFWDGVGYGFRAELIGIAIFLMASSLSPRLREILEIPNDLRGSDEREALIAAKATRLAYTAALFMLTVPGLLHVFVGWSLPTEALLLMAIGLHLIYRGATIYFGRKV